MGHQCQAETIYGFIPCPFRFVLLLVFAFNPQQDPNINFLAILVGAGILQLWALVSGGVYKTWCLDALEGSFTLNLIVLAATAYYVNHSGGNKLAVGYTSVSLALVTFIGILCCHIFQRVRQTKLWKKIPKLNLDLKKLNTKQTADNPNNPITDPIESGNLNQLSCSPPTVASELYNLCVFSGVSNSVLTFNIR